MGNSSSNIPEDFKESMDSKVKDEIQLLAQTKPPDSTSLKDFIEISSKFPVEFPTQTARICNQVIFCYHSGFLSLFI